jgi:hypothetical protein
VLKRGLEIDGFDQRHKKAEEFTNPTANRHTHETGLAFARQKKSSQVTTMGKAKPLMIGPGAERLHKSHVKVTAAQHEAALKGGSKEIKHMVKDNAKPGRTVGGDKNYDTAEFVAGCRRRGCTPHVWQNNTNRRSAIDGRTTRHPSYRISTVKRKRIEEPDRDRRRSAQDTPLRTGGRVRARKHESPVPARPGPPWMDQVSRPDFSSEWICCDET